MEMHQIKNNCNLQGNNWLTFWQLFLGCNLLLLPWPTRCFHTYKTINIQFDNILLLFGGVSSAYNSSNILWNYCFVCRILLFRVMRVHNDLIRAFASKHTIETTATHRKQSTIDLTVVFKVQFDIPVAYLVLVIFTLRL